MITLQTITGLLIAAVLNVLGTGQHEVASVENEPVVKKEIRSFAPMWFHLKEDGDPEDANDYELANGTGSAPQSCNPGDEEICSIFAEPNVDGTPDLETVNENLTTYRDVTN